jgi:RNA polymerase sigma-70 factor, ECF subfamily
LRLVSGNTTIAEDVLQDVFVLIYRKLAWLREPELFRAWTYRIASREAFKRLRKEHRWSETAIDETVLETFAAPTSQELFEPELIAALPELLEKISPTSRAVIALHYFEDLSLNEVADVLELPLGTVKSRLAYGLQSLRRKLQPHMHNRRIDVRSEKG